MRWGFLLLFVLLLPWTALGEETVPDRFGAAAVYGHAYDPEAIDFVLVSGFALFDYDRVWPHRAPEPLRFKVEGSLGTTVARGSSQTVASAGMLALYYLDALATARLHPYAEAGIGLIYTDFQVSGQGLRVNFNPQAGVGTEIRTGDGPPWFAALRLHHVSNGGLHGDNRGINSAVLQVGRFF